MPTTTRMKTTLVAALSALIVQIANQGWNIQLSPEQAGDYVALMIGVWHGIEIAAPWVWRQFQTYFPPPAHPAALETHPVSFPQPAEPAKG